MSRDTHGNMKSLVLVSFIFLINLEQQGCMSSRIITNPGVEHAGDGIFHFKQKDDYTDVTESLYDELNVFCYGGKSLMFICCITNIIINYKYFFLQAHRYQS